MRKGNITMKLTAKTMNGTHTIEDIINVSEDIPFEIERISATRTYPLNDYPMYIKIKANQDFTGTITETVPTSFDIIESHQTGVEGDYAAFTKKQKIDKTITYSVDMKKGETYTFDYTYDPPNMSPEFFLLGNLQFRSETRNSNSETNSNTQNTNDQNISDFDISASNLTHQEGRYWQIANDATDILTSGTTWTVPSDWDDATNSIEVLAEAEAAEVELKTQMKRWRRRWRRRNPCYYT